MKKALYIIGFIVLFSLGIFGIYYFSIPEKDDNYDGDVIIKSKDDYSVSYEDKHFKCYQVNKNMKEDFDFKLMDLSIEYENNIFYINKEAILEKVIMFNKFSIYDDDKLVLFLDNINDSFSNVVIYDLFEKKYDLISKIDDMYISRIDMKFTNTGFVVEKSIVDKDNVLINEKWVDICNIKDDNMVVKETVEYMFDKNLIVFNLGDKISELKMGGYKSNNKYCK